MQHNHRGEVRKQRKQHCRQRQDWGKVESDGVRKLIEHDVRATLREKKKEKSQEKGQEVVMSSTGLARG